jgi:cytochrome b
MKHPDQRVPHLDRFVGTLFTNLQPGCQKVGRGKIACDVACEIDRRRSSLKVSEESPNKTIMVWDPLVRVFHWSLVLFFFLAYLTEGNWLRVHVHAGYTIGLLILFRILWGFLGFGFARFAGFVATPGQTLNYLQQLVAQKPARFVGHNPAGGAMIFVLLFVLLSTVFTGMCLLAMEGSGPLSATPVTDWSGPFLEELHDLSANVTLVLIIIHITGVLFSSRLHKENLTIAMLTGRKRKE